MYKFKTIKIRAGMVAGIPSLILILTKTPKNIRTANPPDEINKMGLYISPTIRPKAPNNWENIVIKPNFSRLNRLNSLFIWSLRKYEMQ